MKRLFFLAAGLLLLTAGNSTLHVTFSPQANAVRIPFYIHNESMAGGAFTTALIIDLGAGNAANLADLNRDNFVVSARNTRRFSGGTGVHQADAGTVVFDGIRKITRMYVNTERALLGHSHPSPGSPDLVTGAALPASGRYIIIELDFWAELPNVRGETIGAISGAEISRWIHTLDLGYRINTSRDLVLANGSSILPNFELEGVINPVFDKFVTDETAVPGTTGRMQLLVSIDEQYKTRGPLPLFVYNHGGGRGGLAEDRFAPLSTQSPASELTRLQFQDRKKYAAHIIATQSHSTADENLDLFRAYIQKLIDNGIVDPNRIYMSGFSMGSAYTMAFWTRHTDFLAAIVPVAGGFPSAAQITTATERHPGSVRNVGIWAFRHLGDGEGGKNIINWIGDPQSHVMQAGFKNLNLTIFQTNQSFGWPYFGADWHPHECETAVYASLIREHVVHFSYSTTGTTHADFANGKIFDWIFAQSR